MLQIATYLAHHEGVGFTRKQLEAVLEMNHWTLKKHLDRILHHADHGDHIKVFYKDRIEAGMQKRNLAFYYAVLGSRAKYVKGSGI